MPDRTKKYILPVRIMACSWKNRRRGEIAEFAQRRLTHIRQTLEESSIVSYSGQEIESLVAKAGLADPIMVGYAVGWSSLNRGMDLFVPLLLFGISILLIPLFGEDSKTRMREFILSTKRGRMPLAYARILTAYGAGSILYLCGVAEYAFIKLSVFGFEGGGLLICIIVKRRWQARRYYAFAGFFCSLENKWAYTLRTIVFLTSCHTVWQNLGIIIWKTIYIESEE